MRIIAGEWGSRRIKSIPGDATRPTPDRLRETLFDILQSRVGGATFVDAYAGTGAVGLEALSRGARHAYLLERDRNALATLRDNVATLQAQARATIVPGPVLKTLAQYPADITFLDPPYPLEKEYAAGLEILGRGARELVVVQHSVRFALAEAYAALRRTRVVRQGDNAISFFEA